VLATAIAAAEPQVEVDSDEVIRRGDSVTHTGDGIQAGEDVAIGESLALPPDDSGKWFILVFIQRNCQPCQQLKRDWAHSKDLQAWAKPDDKRRSWAHYSEIQAEDGSQAARLQAYKITTFPTVVIQPPRTGDFGDPATVVMQRSGYDGKPDKLAGAMSIAVKDYVAKVYRTQKNQLADGYRQFNDMSGPPPFNPPPRPDQSYPFYPAGPTPAPFGPAFTIPPGPSPATIDQLKAACPGADGDFLLSQLASNATVEQAVAAWNRDLPKSTMGIVPKLALIAVVVIGCFLATVTMLFVMFFAFVKTKKMMHGLGTTVEAIKDEARSPKTPARSGK